jgi:hypothetical protein
MSVLQPYDDYNFFFVCQNLPLCDDIRASQACGYILLSSMCDGTSCSKDFDLC